MSRVLYELKRPYEATSVVGFSVGKSTDISGDGCSDRVSRNCQEGRRRSHFAGIGGLPVHLPQCGRRLKLKLEVRLLSHSIFYPHLCVGEYIVGIVCCCCDLYSERED